MSIAFHDTSRPVFVRALKNLLHVFEKGLSHAETVGFDPQILIDARLYPDMHPLSRQIRIATDTAAGAAARLAGVEVPVLGHDEPTAAVLKARIAAAIAFIEDIPADRFEDGESRQIEIVRQDRTVRWVGQNYLLEYAIPNLFFHVTTAYAILRHNGVPVGKKDFLGT